MSEPLCPQCGHPIEKHDVKGGCLELDKNGPYGQCACPISCERAELQYLRDKTLALCALNYDLLAVLKTINFLCTFGDREAIAVKATAAIARAEGLQ